MRPWSHSRLSTYETCPKQYQYNYIERLPGFRPESPAASRGTAIHERAQLYLEGKLMMYPHEFQRVSAHLMTLKAKKAMAEKKLAVRVDWSPCEYDDSETYFRAIIDVIYVDEPSKVCGVEDHKTGQIYDYHEGQLSNYVAVAAAHFPDYEYHSRLIYVDQGIVTKPKITPANRVKPIRIMMDGRIKLAEEDTIFPTKPGSHCKWCDYSQRYGGPCRF
jgi:CRISPR/Cas system-associated exonuclease Cas4 (RecB family)